MSRSGDNRSNIPNCGKSRLCSANACKSLSTSALLSIPSAVFSCSKYLEDSVHLLIRPEIAPADTRAHDLDDRIGGIDDARVRNVLDTNVARAVHDCCMNAIVVEDRARTCTVEYRTKWIFVLKGWSFLRQTVALTTNRLCQPL